MIVREFRDFLGKELIPHYGEANYNANKRLYQNLSRVIKGFGIGPVKKCNAYSDESRLQTA